LWGGGGGGGGLGVPGGVGWWVGGKEREALDRALTWRESSSPL